MEYRKLHNTGYGIKITSSESNFAKVWSYYVNTKN